MLLATTDEGVGKQEQKRRDGEEGEQEQSRREAKGRKSSGMY